MSARAVVMAAGWTTATGLSWENCWVWGRKTMNCGCPGSGGTLSRQVPGHPGFPGLRAHAKHQYQAASGRGPWMICCVGSLGSRDIIAAGSTTTYPVSRQNAILRNGLPSAEVISEDLMMHAMKQRLRQWMLFPLTLACAASAGAGWQQDWNESGPAFGLSTNDQLRVTGATGGAALIAFSNGYEYRLSQVGAPLGNAWNVAVPSSEWLPAGAVPEPDGSALLMFTGTSYASVARFNASGVLQWSSALQGKHFAVGADRVAAMLMPTGESVVVTAIDRASGQLRWQSGIPGLYDRVAQHAPLAVANDGATYVVGLDGSNDPVLAKLDPLGAVLWLVPVATNDRVAVRDGRVFVAGPVTVQALNATDGQPLWRKDDCGVYDSELSFVAADPLCVAGPELVRLAAANGAEVWRNAIVGDLLGVFGGDVYTGEDLISFPTSSGVLQRLAGSSGVPQWQQSLAFPVRGRIWQVSDTLLGIAGPGPTPDTVALHRYLIQDGSLSDVRTLADVPRGVTNAGEIRDGADLFVLGQAPWKTLPARVRRLAADSGSVLWENAATPRAGDPGIALTPNRLLLAEKTAQGNAAVRSLDRVSGQLRWERSITDGPVYSSTAKPPRILGLGDDDALVSFGYGNPNGPTPSRRVQELQRLDDAAGQLLWKKQVAEWSDPSFNMPWVEPALLGIGDDALLWPVGGVTGPMAMGVQRRSGSDGELVFSQAAAPLSPMVRLSVAADAVFAVTFPDQDTLRLVKHSASSGALLWQFDYPRAGWYGTAVLDLLPLADGDALLLVQFYQSTSAEGQVTDLLRIKADGSGVHYAYRTNMQGKTRNIISRIVLGDKGEALLRRLLYRDRRGIEFLQRFDLEQGVVLGSQALTLRGIEPFAQRTAWSGTFVPHGDGVLITGIAQRSPLPSTRRDALLDTTVLQHGDLALQLPVFPAGINVGDSVPFTVGVSYAGDVAVTDATLIVELPWQGGESGLSCAGAGVTRCELQLRHGQLVARFDAAPGAQLELGGTLRRLAAPTLDKSVLRAMVHAPIGLEESEIYNNFGSVAVDGPIFADGFDG